MAQVTPWLLLTPVFAMGLGIAFWGDRPGPRLLIGGAMVLGGVPWAWAHHRMRPVHLIWVKRQRGPSVTLEA